MLEALHPGRIDLGIGRAPGTDRRTAAALRRIARRARRRGLPRRPLDLMGLLGDLRGDAGCGTSSAPRRRPASSPEIVLLGSSGYSAQLAGHARACRSRSPTTSTSAARSRPSTCTETRSARRVARRALRHRDRQRARRRDRRGGRFPGRAGAACAMLAFAPAGACRSRPRRRRRTPTRATPRDAVEPHRRRCRDGGRSSTPWRPHRRRRVMVSTMTHGLAERIATIEIVADLWTRCSR